MGTIMGIFHQGGVVPVQIAVPEIVSSSAVRLLRLANNHAAAVDAKVFWWKTYPPPTWLLGDVSRLPVQNIDTVDLMGMSGQDMLVELDKVVPPCSSSSSEREGGGENNPEDVVIDTRTTTTTTDDDDRSMVIFLIAPKSATFLDKYLLPPTQQPQRQRPETDIQLHQVYSYKRHVNLDDVDFGGDRGDVFKVLERVVGRRGLGVWSVNRVCH